MKKGFIGTKMIVGQGFGNQLFCYITVRSLAEKHGLNYCILSSELLQRNLEVDGSHSFMHLDYGEKIEESQFDEVYQEKDERLFLGNSSHDIKHGIYISGEDPYLRSFTDNILIQGNLQDAHYFGLCKDQIKQWLYISEKYDSKEFCKDDLCIINIRGGEYSSSPELFLRRKYFLDAIKCMKKINPNMEFIIITDNVNDAKRVLPEYEAFHFSLWKDYVTIKNAKYLIISNSSFAFFAAYTSETVNKVIAPKYWARHNVSDGYWASEQNIYEEFEYLDRKGKLFSAKECKEELFKYKHNSKKYKRLNQKPTGIQLAVYKIQSSSIYNLYFIKRVFRGIKRRITNLFQIKSR